MVGGEMVKMAYDNLSFEQKKQIRDIFISFLQKNNFKIESIEGLRVNATIGKEHPRLKKIVTEIQLSSPLFPNNLPPKLRRKVEVLETKLQARLQAKAISQYFMHNVEVK